MSSPLAILKAFLLMAALVLFPLGVFGLYCLRTWHYDRFTIDPFFDQKQRSELSAMTDAIAAEMAHDAEPSFFESATTCSKS